MRIVFLGTPEFAVPSLHALVLAKHGVLAVYTQPDRPKGRGHQLSESPVKSAALKLGIEIHQPERIRRPEAVAQLKNLAPELMVVVGYGQIIPQNIIDLPPYGILNVHASLLPKYRGAAPIQWAIANGDTETGVTIMQIDAGLDTGDMLRKANTAIGPEETAPELSARLAPLGAQQLLEVLREIETGNVRREKQNNAEASYAPILKKEDGRVDWLLPARQIYNRLRGFNPWPGAYTTFRGQPLILIRVKPAANQSIPPGLLRMEDRKLLAGCGEDTSLELLEVQPAGKRPMHIDAFLNGYKILPGEKMGRVELNLPSGYRYAAGYAGIRKQEQDDIGLIVTDGVAQAAAVFTQNVIQAAPVRIARKHLRSSRGRVAALLVNAGNANCATKTEDRVALASCKAVAKALKTQAEYVLPASTGVIGVELDAKLLTAAVPNLVANLSSIGFEAVARSILTTDTHVKVASADVRLSRRAVRVAGMTKGSGMIHPNMATTLGFVLTDAQLDAKTLHKILVRATERSYNSLTVDGDMSTNDMVALLANGASGVRPSGKELEILEEEITRVMEDLARQIAGDGEGARKLIVIRGSGFKTTSDARKIARSIANSPLVKTAIAGSDPNWGRILAAAGYAGVEFDPSKMDIYLQNTLVCRRGVAADFDEAHLKRDLELRDVEIRVILNGGGKAAARFFTCDFTEGYIRINGSYRT